MKDKYINDVICVPINCSKDFEAIQSKWKKLEKGKDMTVFQSIEWNILLFNEWRQSKYEKLFSNVEVYIAEVSGQEMILPVIVQKHSTKLRNFCGRNAGIYILGQGSYSDYLNVVYDEFCEETFILLLKNVRNKYPNLKVFFSNIREDTRICNYLLKNYTITSERVSVSIHIPSNIDEYNKNLSKHTKQNLRTALNRITKDSMKYKLINRSNITDLATIDEMLNIHIKRIKTKNFNNDDFIHKISSQIRIKIIKNKEINNNIIRESMVNMRDSFTLLVELNDKIAGYIYGLKDNNNVVRIMQNCVDEDYKYYSPMFRGIYDYIIESISKENGLKEIDFTRGDEEYKYKLGGKDTKLYDFEL